MMKPLNSVHLKFWIPVFFAISYLLVILLVFSFEIVRGLNHQQLHAQNILQQISVQSVLPIRRSLEKQEFNDIQAYIGSLSLRNDLDAILLTDAEHQILFSSRYTWQGKVLEQVIPEAGQFNESETKLLRIQTIQAGLLSVIPIEYTLPGNELRNVFHAHLWLQLNTDRNRLAFIKEAVISALWMLLAGLIILSAMIWVLYRYLGNPLLQATAYSHRLASGDYKARLPVIGQGEVSELVEGLHSLATHVDSSIEDLRMSEQRLAITLDSIGDAVIVTDIQGLVTRMNSEAERLTGWQFDTAQGRSVIEVFRIINAKTREPVEHPISKVLREGAVVGLANDTTLISKDGEEYQIADSAAPIRDEDDGVIGVIMVFQDISERYVLQSELKDTLNRLKALTESLPDPCFVLDATGEYLEVLGGSEELLALNRQQLAGKRVAEILPEESAKPIMETIRTTLSTGQPQMLEYSLHVPAGEVYFEGHTTKMDRHEGAAVIWQARDITRRKLAEDSINRLAKYDALTGLPNRRLLETRLQQAVARSQRNKDHGALLFIDLDHFKHINDSLGHLYGDQLLVKIANRLRETLRTEDFAARFGGDEFVILLEDLGHDIASASEHAESVAIKLSDACATPFNLAEQLVTVELSIGIVIFPDDADSQELIKRADIAMYRAKETGRDRACFFSRELQVVAEERLNIQHDLRRAIQEDELCLYIQPKVDADGQWISGEVLVRWQHPERGLMQPGAFIPIAERSSLIMNLDKWVISETLHKFSVQLARLPESFKTLSINLTEPLMMSSGFIDEMKSLLEQTAMEPGRLEFEITERMLLHDHVQATLVIEALRDIGIRFSVDDFGTSCSSLRYLQRLPLDALKIDKSFVDRLPGHNGDAAIVKTIIDMSGHLSLDVIAEGVETESQLDFLITQNCQQFQGYFFARPMPWEQFFQQMANN